MITVYGPRQAPFTEKVVRALAFKQLDFTLREPQRPEDYRRWSPRTGLLPVADFDDERVEDSTAILLRLEELYPKPPLLASDPRTAAAQRNLEEWVDESFIWYWTRWQHLRPGGPQGRPATALTRDDEPGAPSRSRRGGLRLPSWLVRRRTNEDDSAAARLVTEIGHRLGDLSRLLADRPFFYAGQISMADLGVYSMLRTLAEDNIPGARRQLQRHPKLVEFIKRVEEATGGASA